jgi:hypothetical protein
MWRCDPDESHVALTVDDAAKRLNQSAAAVIQAIDSGQTLEGWFVDWEVSPPPAGQ